VDYDAGKNLRLFTRYSQARFNAYDPGTILGTAGWAATATYMSPVIEIVGGATWTISRFRCSRRGFGFSRMKAGKTPPLAGGPSMADQFGPAWAGLPPRGNTPAAFRMCISLMAALPTWAAVDQPSYQNPTVWIEGELHAAATGHTSRRGVETRCSTWPQQTLQSSDGRRHLWRADERHLLRGVLSLPAYRILLCTEPLCVFANSPTTSCDRRIQQNVDYADFLLGYRLHDGSCPAPHRQHRDWGFSGLFAGRTESDHRLTVNRPALRVLHAYLRGPTTSLSNFDLSTKAIKLAPPATPIR